MHYWLQWCCLLANQMLNLKSTNLGTNKLQTYKCFRKMCTSLAAIIDMNENTLSRYDRLLYMNFHTKQYKLIVGGCASHPWESDFWDIVTWHCNPCDPVYLGKNPLEELRTANTPHQQSFKTPLHVHLQAWEIKSNHLSWHQQLICVSLSPSLWWWCLENCPAAIMFSLVWYHAHLHLQWHIQFCPGTIVWAIMLRFEDTLSHSFLNSLSAN